jgi:hypothetical protein
MKDDYLEIADASIPGLFEKESAWQILSPAPMSIFPESQADFLPLLRKGNNDGTL